MSPRPRKRTARDSAVKRIAKRSAKRSGGSAAMERPQRTMPPVPRSWDTVSKDGDAALRALAAQARDAVATAGDGEAVVRALIAFHAGWIETAHGDTEVQENVTAGSRPWRRRQARIPMPPTNAWCCAPSTWRPFPPNDGRRRRPSC
jgi:hypothetical protein